MFKLLTLHNSTGREGKHMGEKKKERKEKSSKQFGEDIKNTLRCQFQFPRVVRDIVRDREPGLVLVVVVQ